MRCHIRLTPNAGRSALGRAGTSSGTGSLRAWVTAAPEKGRANKALLKLLSKSWRIPQSQLQIIAGDKNRNKTLLISGDPSAIADLLTHWYEETS